MSDAPLLRFDGVSKSFFGNPALTDVSLTVGAGEIHALIGENGAGKSTLLNVLFGMPVIRETGGYEGRVILDGEERRFASPFEAMAAGIGMVHQEFMLIPGFSVAENVKLNREPGRDLPLVGGTPLDLVDRPRLGREAAASLHEVGLGIDEWAPVAGLPVGHMQMVEIAREIDKGRTRLLVFDEPTAVLTEEEAARLLDTVNVLANRGVGILLITHRLHEVLDHAHRITVLRDGGVVGSVDAADATLEGLAENMVGRALSEFGARREDRSLPTAGPPALEIRELEVDRPGEQVRGVDLTVRRGEILGIGGLAGHGKVGIAAGILGLHPRRGEVLKDGAPLPGDDPLAVIRAGVAFVSEDRRGVGLMVEESIERNLVVTAVTARDRFLAGPGWLGPFRPVDAERIAAATDRMIGELDIRCSGPDQPVGRLSGGNQQKVCLGRAMLLDPDLLLVSEPTRGIDVGARALVLEHLVRLNRERGVTIVMTSSELAELRAVCDRIAIVYQGKIHRILPPDASDARFGLAMSGEKDVA